MAAITSTTESWNNHSFSEVESHIKGKYLTGITKSQVTTALGYTPPTADTNTHWTTRIYAGASGTAANASATHPYIKITDDNTYRNQIRLIGGGATTVTSDGSGNVTISSTDTNTWPSKVSQLTNDSGFLTAASFTNNNKGTSINKIMVADSNNGLGYTALGNLFAKYGLYVEPLQIGSTWYLAVTAMDGDHWSQIGLPLTSGSPKPKCRNSYNGGTWYDI